MLIKLTTEEAEAYDEEDLDRFGLRLAEEDDYPALAYLPDAERARIMWVVSLSQFLIWGRGRSRIRRLEAMSGRHAVIDALNRMMDVSSAILFRAGRRPDDGECTGAHYDYHHARIALKGLGVYRNRHAKYHYTPPKYKKHKKLSPVTDRWETEHGATVTVFNSGQRAVMKTESGGVTYGIINYSLGGIFVSSDGWRVRRANSTSSKEK